MKNPKEVYLMTVGEDMKAEIIEDELKKEGVPLVKKYRGGGDYLNIYMGKSMYGVDLYVSGDHYEIAREILLDLEITDIEGKLITEVDQNFQRSNKNNNKAQIKMIKIGIFLVFLLWLILWRINA